MKGKIRRGNTGGKKRGNWEKCASVKGKGGMRENILEGGKTREMSKMGGVGR